MLLGLNQEQLNGEFEEKMQKVKSSRSNITLTFVKLVSTPCEEDALLELESKSDMDDALKDAVQEDGRVRVEALAQVVRDVFPDFKNLNTLTQAFKGEYTTTPADQRNFQGCPLTADVAATRKHEDGSMGLLQLEAMLNKLVLFNNEARSFSEIEAMCGGPSGVMLREQFVKASGLLGVTAEVLQQGSAAGDEGGGKGATLESAYEELCGQHDDEKEPAVGVMATPGKANLTAVEYVHTYLPSPPPPPWKDPVSQLDC